MVVVALGEPGLPMTSAACVIDAIRPAMARTQPSRRLTRASAFGDFIASIVSIFPKARCVPKARFNSSDATIDIARILSATGDGIKPIKGRSPVWRQRVRELRDPHRGAQQKMGLRAGDVARVEALVLWLHPKRGMVPPLECIEELVTSTCSTLGLLSSMHACQATTPSSLR